MGKAKTKRAAPVEAPDLVEEEPAHRPVRSGAGKRKAPLAEPVDEPEGDSEGPEQLSPKQVRRPRCARRLAALASLACRWQAWQRALGWGQAWQQALAGPGWACAAPAR